MFWYFLEVPQCAHNICYSQEATWWVVFLLSIHNIHLWNKENIFPAYLELRRQLFKCILIYVSDKLVEGSGDAVSYKRCFDKGTPKPDWNRCAAAWYTLCPCVYLGCNCFTVHVSTILTHNAPPQNFLIALALDIKGFFFLFKKMICFLLSPWIQMLWVCMGVVPLSDGWVLIRYILLWRDQLFIYLVLLSGAILITLVLLHKFRWLRPLPSFSQSDYLILIVNINSYT